MGDGLLAIGDGFVFDSCQFLSDNCVLKQKYDTLCEYYIDYTSKPSLMNPCRSAALAKEAVVW